MRKGGFLLHTYEIKIRYNNNMKKMFVGLVFGVVGLIGESHALVINVKSDVSMGKGGYAITSYEKKKPVFITYAYVGNSVSKEKGKDVVYRVYMSNQKGQFGNGVYRVWLSFVRDDVYKSIEKNLKKDAKRIKAMGLTKSIPSKEDIKEEAASIAANSGGLMLAEVLCHKKEIDIISGKGPFKFKMVYHVNDKTKLNLSIYKRACTPGVLKTVYTR